MNKLTESQIIDNIRKGVITEESGKGAELAKEIKKITHMKGVTAGENRAILKIVSGQLGFGPDVLLKLGKAGVNMFVNKDGSMEFGREGS